MSVDARIDYAVKWALGIAEDSSHGYDQGSRWGPDYDCSSLVITAFEEAGIPVKSQGRASYTGNMSVFTSYGFSDVTSSINLSTGAGLQYGDVLLHTSQHTAIYIGNGQIVHASSNEYGGDNDPNTSGIVGGRTGDQTGGEIAVSNYYNHPWNRVYRLSDDSDATGEAPEYTGPTYTGGSSTDSGVSTIRYYDPNPDYVKERRLSELAAQPLQAYVNIYVGDLLLSTDPAKPNILKDFEITRLQEAACEATFTVFDTNWDEIELYFSQNWDNVRIQYGYADSVLVSDMYLMKLGDYSLSFNSTGVILTVSALSESAIQNLTPRTMTGLGNNPTEAIQEIARQIGLYSESEGLVLTQNVSEEFNMINEHPLTYIKEKILPLATTNDGEVLSFIIDSSNRVLLQRKAFDPINSGDNVKTYIYQKGYDSVVKDITFDIKGVFGGGFLEEMPASGIKSVFIDPLTKEISSHQEDMQSVVTSATGEYQHRPADLSIPSVDPAGRSAEQVSHELYYKVKSSAIEAYEAQMTIVGDPTIKLFEPIRIINVTDEGYLHHTSGIYEVLGIVDSVSGGVMLTTLDLKRNADINDGVALINPRVIVK